MKKMFFCALVLAFVSAVHLTGCAKDRKDTAFNVVLKQKNAGQTAGAAAGLPEQKQVAMLLSENQKIEAAMKTFRRSDPGYAVLSEALAENNASLSRLGYGKLSAEEKNALIKKAPA